MSLLQKIGLLFNEYRRREAARQALSRERLARAEASADRLYSTVSEAYPIKRRRELPQLSDAAYEDYVLKVIETRSMVSTIVAGLAVRKAASKAAPEDDLDTIHRNLGF
jgi:hypothetical protein